MRRDELPLATLDGLQAAYRLAHPCDCGRPHCTLGDHIWDSTRNMAPGPKAATTDPRGRSWPTDTDDTPELTDPTASIHPQYLALLDVYHQAARNLARFIDAYRPDRWVPLPDPITDDDWCRNHLEAGICEPRYRGDLCRRCYEIGLAHNVAPDYVLMRQLNQGMKLTDTLIGDFLARVKVSRRTKRKQAS